MMLTIVILTKNEADRLPHCLDAIPPQYPVIVVDSGSDDETIAIAKSRGCDVYSQPWLGFAGQRNFALKSCKIQEGWVLFIDADECYPPEFFSWFENKSILLENIDVLMVPSWLVFCGMRLRYVPGYPIVHPRLVRAGVAPFIMGHAGHSETITNGVHIERVDIPYDHHFFDGDIDTWMTKHIRLARMEVNAGRPAGVLTSRARLSLLMGKSFLRVPGRFFYHYFVKCGFRDGWRGFLYSLMYAWYELTKYIMTQFQSRDKKRDA